MTVIFVLPHFTLEYEKLKQEGELSSGLLRERICPSTNMNQYTIRPGHTNLQCTCRSGVLFDAIKCICNDLCIIRCTEFIFEMKRLSSVCNEEYLHPCFLEHSQLKESRHWFSAISEVTSRLFGNKTSIRNAKGIHRFYCNLSAKRMRRDCLCHALFRAHRALGDSR
uniref:AlNc14C382G11230 protein n=1 Tax=Albugo laibachii Nc14 TaxID=890382 RepID=F0WYG9_9STRA|nr:AlNc14C382G11230 [Albugo laibachii Nc14]|eukprot:CCA26524.1 AlNc14C382G11230 [Albugo laibachii Nc14]